MKSMNKPIRIILLGPPGAGKGTQALLLANRLGLHHISTGDILRKEIGNNSEFGKVAIQYSNAGMLVPDDAMIEITTQYLKQPLCFNGFILDGFPRTIQQAEKLHHQSIAIDAVIFIDLDDSQLVQRLTGRRNCPKCCRMFHIDLNPPKKTGWCDDCDVELVTRNDDTEATVRHRIEVYQQQTQPLIAFYKAVTSIKFVCVSSKIALGVPSEVHSFIMLQLQKQHVI